jgi:hypothetical protein
MRSETLGKQRNPVGNRTHETSSSFERKPQTGMEKHTTYSVPKEGQESVSSLPTFEQETSDVSKEDRTKLRFSCWKEIRKKKMRFIGSYKGLIVLRSVCGMVRQL